MGGVVVLLGELDILIKRRFDWSSLTETVFRDDLVDVLFLMDANFLRFLFYMHSQVPGALPLVGHQECS